MPSETPGDALEQPGTLTVADIDRETAEQLVAVWRANGVRVDELAIEIDAAEDGGST